ncbi:Hypothetical predicted protein [Mytilus galloprovincialis]|nr:Hypothetical predicted protein [Mytilus galloprovincialis]
MMGRLMSQKSKTMICQTCNNYPDLADRNCSMFIGTSAFRKDTLIAHWKSNSHRKCEEKKKSDEMKTIEASGSCSSSQSGPLLSCVRKMEKENEDKIKKLITTAYFICNHEKPFTDFPRLVELQEVNGLDMGNFYRSDNACRRFIQYIYEDLFKGVKMQIENDLHFYSILIDGATDSSVTENELIYLRFVENGRPVNHYFSIEDVEKADAQGILKEIEGAFTRNGIPNWKDKLIGFGSDGASVNLGCRGGIATLIKRDVPHLVITHCIAHRLELAANSAIKNHKHMKEIQDLLQYLYKHYQYSPKALRELRQIGEALEEKVLKPTKLAGTRWLPHIHRALEVLVREFRVLLAHFEHIRESRSGSAEVQGRATFISKKLKEYKFLYIVFFFLDILKVLSVLSLKFQQDYLTLSAMFDAISTANLSLIELKTVNGKELTNFLATVDSQNSTYKDIQLSNMNIDEDFTRQKQVIVDLIVAALDNRFEPMEKDPVLKAASLILSFSEWPQDRNDLATYGNEEMAYLLENFHEILERNGCNLDAIMDQNGEWKDFKAYIGRHKATVAVENFFIYPDLKRRFINMILVLELLLSFPLSSAVCERGFSAMKRVKTDWRSSLKPEMLIISLYSKEFVNCF